MNTNKFLRTCRWCGKNGTCFPGPGTFARKLEFRKAKRRERLIAFRVENTNFTSKEDK